MIKVGDRVKFINDIGAGKVIKIDGSIVTVDREDGFEVPSLITELVVVDKAEELRVISKIGVSDPRPGQVKRNKAEQQAYRDQKKFSKSALNRYGRITITSDYEDEDEPIDIYSMKEAYTRNVANINHHITQLDSEKPKEEVSRPVNDTSIFDIADKIATAEDYEEKKVDKEAIKESITTIKREAKPAKQRKPAAELEVVDLHAHEILESERGMSSGDILNYQLDCFIAAIDERVEKKIKCKIVFIHGVGSGKLKYEITKILRHRYPKLYYQDASFKEYGYGAIMVIINQ